MFFNKKSPQADEKRKFERVDFMQATYFMIAQGASGTGDAPALDCWFNNISIGGLSIDIHDDTLALGDEIVVLYKLGSKLRRDRVVVRFIQRILNNYRCGCLYIDEDQDRTAIIQEYVHSQHLQKA